MNRSLKILLVAGCMATILFTAGFRQKHSIQIAENEWLKISVSNTDNAFWEYTIRNSGKTLSFKAPEFEIDGKAIVAKLTGVKLLDRAVTLRNGVKEYAVEGNLALMPDITLKATFQVSENNPIVRFRYELLSDASHQLTKSKGNDQLTYFGVSLKRFSQVKEIRLSEFNEMVHSFCLSERILEDKHFAESIHLMGPLMEASDGSNSMILGYEHGSQAPDHFLEFGLAPDHSISLRAVKGNYYNGYKINKEHSFQTIWLETGAVSGNEDLLSKNYRNFVLHTMSQNAESRKPYIFYNT